MSNFLVIEEAKKLFRFRRLAFYLTWGRIKQAERDKFLGRIWSLLDPLAQLGIYYFMFNVVFKSRIENFVIYLFSAIIAFEFLSQSVQLGAMTIVSNRGLISEAYFPKAVLPFSVVLSKTHDFFYALLILLGIMILSGINITLMIFFLPIIFLIEFLFTLGLSIISSVVGVFFRDIQNILGLIFRILFYLSGTMYDISRLPEDFQPVFKLNPIYIFYESYRSILLYGKLPPLTQLSAVGLTAILVLGASLILIEKKEGQFVKYL
jgi:lipopolysaccharide transport system permease protein